MVVGLAVRPSSCGVGFVVVIEDEHLMAAVKAAQPVEGVPVAALLQPRKEGKPLRQGVIVGRVKRQAQARRQLRERVAAFGGGARGQNGSDDDDSDEDEDKKD